MSTVEVVGITTVGSLLTVLISRVRFIWRPCAEDPEKRCQSGCTDAHLDKSDNEITVSRECLNGRDVLVINSRE